jgi:hypothetical protein
MIDDTAAGKLNKKDAFMLKLRKRYAISINDDQEARTEALDDLKFARGDQWPAAVRQRRESEDLPCLTIDRLQGPIDLIVGAMLQNRPAIKVRPADNAASPIIGDIMAGKIRDIENKSAAGVVYETSAKSAIVCGRGFHRVITQYKDNESFQQEMRIKRITNQLSVSWDPLAQDYNLNDARWMFVTGVMGSEEFEEMYPGHKAIEFETDDLNELNEWSTSDKIRLVEYYYRETKPRTIYLLRDGSVTDRKPKDNGSILQKRETDESAIMYCLASGSEVLEGPEVLPGTGKYYPIIPVWGKEVFEGDARDTFGIVRPAKDAQRMYNFMRSKSAETITQAPSAPYVVSAEQIQGYEHMWQHANEQKNALIYNTDPNMPNHPPARSQPPQIPIGFANEAVVSAEEIKSTTNIYEASLGEQSNETSGKAIIARQSKSDNSTYVFMHHLHMGIEQTGRVIVDWMPYVYAEERETRIRNEDGSERFVPINKQLEIGDEYDERNGYIEEDEENMTAVLNPLNSGEYNVVISTGPSYQTQREQMVDSILEFIKIYPDSAPVLGPILARNMDWHESNKISRILEIGLSKEVRDEMHKDDEELPVEGDEEQEEQVDPAMQMEMERMQIDLEKLRVDLQTAQARAAQAQAEAEEAEIQSDMAKRELLAMAQGDATGAKDDKQQ